MPGYEQRASILQGAGDKIFNMVCDRATSKQWAGWLRAPLEHAAGMADAELVDKLLKAGADGSSGWKGCSGSTLLHAGAKGGNEQVMSALMRAGARKDIHSKVYSSRRTPLHAAVSRGNVVAAKMLILAGADVNNLDAKHNGPLHLAIVKGHAGLAEDLLLSGANPDLLNGALAHPIHLAARRGQDGVVRSLLCKGVDVNFGVPGGPTALGIAMRSGHISTARVLLDAGADATTSNCGGITPLHLAAYKDRGPDIIAALVEAGADMEARNDSGVTPLIDSARGNSCRAMLNLLQRGAMVNARASCGSTPLHAACRKSNACAADLLLRWGADETAVNDQGQTPSASIPALENVPEDDRPKIERLTRLLAFAPQDKAWRRRGFLVLCRTHQERLRLAVKIPHTAESERRPLQRSKRRPGSGQVKLEVMMGGDHRLGAVCGASTGGGVVREGSSNGSSGGFDGVAAWLVAPMNEDIFRKIVGYL